MYVLIDRKLLPEGKYYEEIPDGRCIVPLNEVKGMSLVGVDIIPSAAEMKKLIEKQKTEIVSTNKEVAGNTTPMVEILPADDLSKGGNV